MDKQKGIKETWDTLTWGNFLNSICIFWLFIAKLSWKIMTWFFRFISNLATSMAKKSEKLNKQMERKYGRI